MTGWPQTYPSNPTPGAGAGAGLEPRARSGAGVEEAVGEGERRDGAGGGEPARVAVLVLDGHGGVVAIVHARRALLHNQQLLRAVPQRRRRQPAQRLHDP